MRPIASVLAAIAAAAPAFAHTGHDPATVAGFGAGFAHPLSGADHLLALLAVGVWAAQQGGRAVWLVPLAFIATMALGGLVGFTGIGIGGVETVIIASVLVLGAVIAAALKPPLWVAAPLVGAFAFFHGVAHGAEMPGVAAAPAYAVGFMAATAALHGVGIGLAVALRRRISGVALRAVGFAQVGAGTLLAAGLI